MSQPSLRSATIDVFMWSFIPLMLFGVFLPGMGLLGKIVGGLCIFGLVLVLLTVVVAALKPARPKI